MSTSLAEIAYGGKSSLWMRQDLVVTSIARISDDLILRLIVFQLRLKHLLH
jgi:hypothetical protein